MEKHCFVTKVNHQSLHQLRGTTKFKRYFKGIGFLNKGNEGIEAKRGARIPLPPLDGGIRQSQNGVCFYESRTPNLSKEE